MYKILRSDKDTYITDRVIKGVRVHNSNVGGAGTLDLFKLYGYTTSGSLNNPNIELSRLLIHFDLDPLRDLLSLGKIDPGNTSFKCTLKLFDVYGGQPTPSNFTVVANPLSRSFEEGVGRDIVYYADVDLCNFLSGSSSQGKWLLSGCSLGGGLPGTVDYITSSTNVLAGQSLSSTQLFTTGEENLELDVTLAISATLAQLLPDEGFRIAFNASHETDQYTYFVKRFSSRTAYDESKRPQLIVKFDDSVQDDSQSLYTDSQSYIFLNNYVRHAPANLTSGSLLTQITGSNSLKLKLMTEISGGWYSLYFTGSQHYNGIFPTVGVYSASVLINSTDSVIKSKMTQSGSVKLTPVWYSLDNSVTYLTGSTITLYNAQRGATIDDEKLTVSVHGVHERYFSDEETIFKVHLFDSTSPLLTATRIPVERPGVVLRDCHYQVRDDVTGEIVIPFDTVTNSTRLSSDAKGMYFKLDMSNLTRERTYVIDILVKTGVNRQVYKAASPIFRVSDSR